MVQIGNIGVITTIDDTLCEVTGMRDGLIYCLPMTGDKCVRICLPDQFWVLLDSF